MGLAFAKMFKHSKVYLTDMSESSLQLMKHNVSANQLEIERVLVHSLLWSKENSKSFLEG